MNKALCPMQIYIRLASVHAIGLQVMVLLMLLCGTPADAFETSRFRLFAVCFIVVGLVITNLGARTAFKRALSCRDTRRRVYARGDAYLVPSDCPCRPLVVLYLLLEQKQFR